LGHNIEALNREILTHSLAPPHLIHPTTPAHIKTNPIRHPIHPIIDHYKKPTKDTYNMINKNNTHTYANGYYRMAYSTTKISHKDNYFPIIVPGEPNLREIADEPDEFGK
jgi:hypothetical protein